MKKRKIILIGLVAVLIVACVISIRWYATQAYKKWFMLAIYGNAWSAFQEDHGASPSTLDELEQSYNRSELRRFEFPVEPGQARPIFRNCKKLGHGPFVVLIDSPSSHWHLRLWRYVITACGDEPETDRHARQIRSVWWWQLDDLIREDDAKRRSAGSS